MTEPTRRAFLQSSAAAGLTLASSAAGLYAANGQPLRVGLIGCGGRGTGAVRDILEASARLKNNPAVEIVAVADAFQEQTDRILRDFANSKNFAPYRAQIKVTPETAFHGLDAYQKVLNAGVDIVLLATPPGFRPQHLAAAIEAGKHVFTEKPVAVDAAGARLCYALIDKANAKELSIVAGTQRRHQKGYIETIRRIHEGAIGDIIATRCSWNGTGIWFRNRRPGQPDAAYQIYNWYHFLWLCGDHIVEQHVHNIDVINWVMNDHPIRAVGMGGRTVRPSGDPKDVGNIWDHFAVEYEYKNGVRMYSFCRHTPGDSDVSETVFGSKGRCRVDQYQINGKRVADDDISPYVQEHIDLLTSIVSGKPLNELKAVTDSTFTAILGRNAAYACRSLRWDEALSADEDYFPKNLTMDMSLSVSPAPVPGGWKLPPKAQS
jgi:predicted dehydrogenase